MKNFIRKSYFSVSENSEEVPRFACPRVSWLKRTVNFTIISSYFMHCTITCRGYCKRQLTDIASRRKLSRPLIFHRLAFAAVVTFQRFSCKIGKDRRFEKFIKNIIYSIILLRYLYYLFARFLNNLLFLFKLLLPKHLMNVQIL